MATVHTVPADLDVWERYVLGASDRTSAEIGHISGLGEAEVERIKASLRSRGVIRQAPIAQDCPGPICMGCGNPFKRRRNNPAFDKFCGRACMGRWQIKERERQKIEKQIEKLCGAVWWKPGPELLKLCREARREILAGTSPPLKLV